MTILYFLIGFFAAIIAAAPPGAANVLVVNTSVKETVSKAAYIIVGAGLGELFLSFIALHYVMNLTDFFEENSWVQISVFVLFILIGAYFLLQNKITTPETKLKIKNLKTPKLLKGLLLAFLNPPVLIFWVLAFTLIHKHILKVSDMSPVVTLLLFFSGVFIGKMVTLYAYSLWGKKLEESHNDTKKTIRLFIGIALLLLGTIQGIRFFTS